MSDESLQKLVEGYRDFRKQYVDEQYMAYRVWASKMQEPKVMIIACSDSRVNPAILTHAGLGEVFMVNNVANLVPPYKEGKDTHHSTSAALEYALLHLKVEHIIVLGHSGCGGIKALMQGTARPDQKSYSFIEPWVEIAQEAKTRVLKKYPKRSEREQAACCEKEALRVSLENLQTFPWVKSAQQENHLHLHAWYFEVGSGELERYDESSDRFMPLLDSKDKS